MAKAHPFTVINISRSKLALCGTYASTPLVLNFPTSSIRDMEIVNPAEIAEQIKTFVTQNQIRPTPLVMVLGSDICFEKDLTGLAESDVAMQTQKFIDTVPLATVSSKIFKIQNTQRLVVINRHFYEALKSAFESLGFSVTAAVPGFVLGELGVKDEFSAASCLVILRRVEFLKENSFTSSEVLSNFTQKKQQFLKGNQLVLGLLSGLAVIFLAVTAYFTLRKPPAPQAVLAPLAVVPRVGPTVVPNEVPATPSAVFAAYTVRILNASGTEGAAATVQEQLATLGITQFTVGNSQTISPNTLVIFKPGVTTPARQMVIDVISETHPTVSSQENATSQFDISVTIGQNPTPTP